MMVENSGACVQLRGFALHKNNSKEITTLKQICACLILHKDLCIQNVQKSLTRQTKQPLNEQNSHSDILHTCTVWEESRVSSFSVTVPFTIHTVFRNSCVVASVL